MEFNLKEYWENRYKTKSKNAKGNGSGSGSEGIENEFKCSFVNTFIHNNGIKSVVDYGCGAGNFTALLKGFDIYQGYDISEACINLCRDRFTNVNRLHFTANEAELNKAAELGISMDVLFHQVDDVSFYNSLRQLFRHKFVIIYSYNHSDNTGMLPHMKIRNISGVVKREFVNYELVKECQGYEKKVFLIYRRVGE